MILTQFQQKRTALIGGLLLSFCIMQLTVNFLHTPVWVSAILIWSVWLLSLTDLTPSVRKQVLMIYGVAGVCALIFALSGGKFSAQDWLYPNLNMLMLLAAMSFLGLLNTKPVLSDSTSNPVITGKKGLVSTMLGLNLFGAVINLSVLYVIGDHLQRNNHGRLSRSHRLVLNRIFCTASHWSPFMISMAVTLSFAPDLDLKMIFLFGGCFALTTILGTLWELRGEATRTFKGYPLRWKTLKVPLALAISVIAGHHLAPASTMLAWVSLMAPLVALVAVRSWPWSAATRQHVSHNLAKLSDPVVIFLGAGLLSAGIGGLIDQFHWSFENYAEQGFMWYHAGTLVILIVSCAVIGIHPLISVAVLIPLTEPFNPNPTLLGFSMLMAWGIASTMNPISASNLLIASRYQLDIRALIQMNIPYAIRQVTLSFLFAWILSRVLS